MSIDLNDASGELSRDGLLKLTEEEQNYLQSFLDRGDRAGYYMALYNMIGNEQALQQAQIATFSEGVGGTAFLANFLEQRLLPTGEYPGIYYLSQAVAEESLSVIQSKLEAENNLGNINTGYISEQEMFDSARTAWRERWLRDDPLNGRNMEPYFPGNLLDAFSTGADIVAALALPSLPTTEQIYQSVGEVLAAMYQNGESSVQQFIDRLISAGAGYALFGILGGGILGKQLADFESDPARYAIQELPDARYKVAIDTQTNTVVGVFDNTFLPSSVDELLSTLAANAIPIAAAIVGGPTAGLVALGTTLLSQGGLSEFHKMLSESSPGFNGDVNPIMQNPDYSQAQAGADYLLTETPTGGNDTLWGSGGLFTFLHADTLAGGAGDDRIFGGDGGDTLHGNNGADIVYGQAGNDTLHGEAGNDILRGGAGHDRLFGDDGNDRLDGDDINPATPGGNDILDGGAGDDILVGGGGNDSLRGGLDNDDLLGGLGLDTYHYTFGDGVDQILDTDGQGRILYTDANGAQQLLTGGRQLSVGGNLYQSSTEPSIQYRRETDGGLTVVIAGVDAMTIQEHQEGDLGITLEDLSGTLLSFTGAGDPSTWRTVIQGDVGGISNDDLIADPITEVIQGGGGDDILTGRAGEANYVQAIQLYGGAGEDIIYGEYFYTTRYYDIGAAAFEAEQGRIQPGIGAQAYGGAGNDFLQGGLENDYLEGGYGEDIYHYRIGDGVDDLRDIDGRGRILYTAADGEAVDYLFREAA